MKKLSLIILSLALVTVFSMNTYAEEPMDLRIETYDVSISESGMFGTVRTETREQWEPYHQDNLISEVEFLEKVGLNEKANEASSHHSRKTALTYGGALAGGIGLGVATAEAYSFEPNTSIVLISSAAGLVGIGAAYAGYNMSETYLSSSQAQEILDDYYDDNLNTSFSPSLNIAGNGISVSFGKTF